jgi:undecaprenyl-diphosphatase
MGLLRPFFCRPERLMRVESAISRKMGKEKAMELLRALAAVRTPFWNTVFGYLTYLGEQTVFMAVGLIVLWCVDKKWGYRLFYMGLLGSAVNQLLKGIFLLPRPWVVDPSFQIVESARAARRGIPSPAGIRRARPCCLAGWRCGSGGDG